MSVVLQLHLVSKYSKFGVVMGYIVTNVGGVGGDRKQLTILLSFESDCPGGFADSLMSPTLLLFTGTHAGMVSG